MALDGAGRPLSRALAVPANVTLVVPPPPDQARGRLHSPKPDPVERVRLHLRKRFLSLRLRSDLRHRRRPARDAWMRSIAEPDRIRSPCARPWIKKVSP